MQGAMQQPSHRGGGVGRGEFGDAAQTVAALPSRHACAAALAPADRYGPIASPASAVERGVLDHPLHQLIERDARMRGEFRHERCFGHAGMGIDFEAERPPVPSTRSS